ncbi:MAG: DUF434 domain-containing protein [Blastocatellia bacterium]
MSPDRRRHRGAHGEDRFLFGPDQLERLRDATSDLSWMLGREYSAKSALKLVGDRYGLRDRQRLAVSRAACSDNQVRVRESSRLDVSKCVGGPVIIDGFNLLITIEAGLSGGVLIIGRDGCPRDLSGVHGSYRTVDETEAAIRLAGQSLEYLRVASCTWVLDEPVSNSGRLAGGIRDAGKACGWLWEVELAMNPDKVLIGSDQVVITSDSVVLDQAARWVNLGAFLVKKHLADSWVLDFRRKENSNKKL